MRVIPPKGSIPRSIRGKSRGGIGIPSLNIRIGGMGGLGEQPQREKQDDFKIKSTQGEKKPEEKISLDEIKKGVILELAHLFELERLGLKENLRKKKWLLEFIPEILRDEILKEAKEKEV